MWNLHRGTRTKAAAQEKKKRGFTKQSVQTKRRMEWYHEGAERLRDYKTCSSIRTTFELRFIHGRCDARGLA